MGDSAVDYGPLAGLIGRWQGDKGVDIAPEPDGTENNPYYETITYTDIGNATNAGRQTLAVLHYQQIVHRKSDGNVFHHENGYWMWDAATSTVMHSLVIPRAVCVLAGGQYQGETSADGRVVIEVAASLDSPDWRILQSPFMRDNARTSAFRQRFEVGDGRLSFSQTTVLEIYGKTVDHTDDNELTRT